jgi:hypothetical protein
MDRGNLADLTAFVLADRAGFLREVIHYRNAMSSLTVRSADLIRHRDIRQVLLFGPRSNKILGPSVRTLCRAPPRSYLLDSR